jgi:hypothetical protein
MALETRQQFFQAKTTLVLREIARTSRRPQPRQYVADLSRFRYQGKRTSKPQ